MGNPRGAAMISQSVAPAAASSFFRCPGVRPAGSRSACFQWPAAFGAGFELRRRRAVSAQSVQIALQTLHAVDVLGAARAAPIHHEVGMVRACEISWLASSVRPLALALCNTSLRHSRRSSSGVMPLFPWMDESHVALPSFSAHALATSELGVLLPGTVAQPPFSINEL